MATNAIALGANIQSAITAGAAGDTYTFAAGTYYAQSWTPKNGDFYIGHASGTVLSGGWKPVFSVVSGNWYKATTGSGDLFTGSTFPQPINTTARVTGSITATTLNVASTQSGTVAAGTVVYGNGVASFTRITGGSAPNWTITPSQTVAVGTSMILINHAGSPQDAVAPSGDSNFFWTERCFVDGVKQTRINCAATPADPGAGNFYYSLSDNSLNINIGANPSGHLVEYTATATILDTSSAINNVTLSNLTVEKYGYYPSRAPFTFYGSQTGWNFYNVILRYNHSYGLNYGAPSYPLAATQTLRIKGGAILDNGFAGISGSMGAGSIDGVEIARNGVNFVDSTGDAGGFKLYECLNVTVTNCVVHDNGGPGIWFDIDCANIVIDSNLVYNNTASGIMYEICWGPAKITNNTVYGSGPNVRGGDVDPCIYISNSNDVECYGNICTVRAGKTATVTNGRVRGGIDSFNNVRGNSSTAPHSGEAYESRNLKIHHNTITYLDSVGPSDAIGSIQAIAGGSNNYKDFNTYYTPNNTAAFWYRSTDAAVNTSYTWAAYQAAGFEPNSTNIVGVAKTTVPAEFVGPDVRNTYGPVTLVALDIAVVSVANTAVAALSAGHRTLGGWIQNPAGAPANLGINEQGTATGTTSSGSTTFIPPGARYKLTPASGAVSVISQVAGHAFSGQGWT